MLQFGLRLGERPRQVITTTPRPIALLKKLIADPRTAVTHAGTRANAYNLAPAFLDTVLARYRGTRLGRQEIDGEIIEERTDALWKRAALEACRVQRGAAAAAHRGGGRSAGLGARTGADACGIVAAGRGRGRHASMCWPTTAPAGLSPQAWAMKAIALWRRLAGRRLVAEVN